MQCVICKQGATQPGTTTVTLTRGEVTLVIKKVPADICENCGEYYLSDEISRKILTLAEEAMKHNLEVEVIQFAA
ncbi:MAG: type II toxin-antitoxin system MqsA family antitoxin [Marinospirillum sp.]|uniref:type II toxin-antitoxin system MqsA family antitoxin n=1 Tax=Marinospirillum sp. TaxID=2183934 RepID=UPI001A0D7392|nr:type II toxin-antitoxin system MqsA family antitoxin [Marinospirillum sp.]MBE0508902.1 type II toxin-antitoxin system MqsA family antitoxin [Marinospirillum sp.]